MSAWAKPGVKCVCVDASNWDGWWADGEKPVEGATYTVRRSFLDAAGVHVIDFMELQRSPVALANFGYDSGYRIQRFRPLITQEDDVRLIKSLLLEDAGLVPAGVELDA